MTQLLSLPTGTAPMTSALSEEPHRDLHLAVGMDSADSLVRLRAATKHLRRFLIDDPDLDDVGLLPLLHAIWDGSATQLSASRAAGGWAASLDLDDVRLYCPSVALIVWSLALDDEYCCAPSYVVSGYRARFRDVTGVAFGGWVHRYLAGGLG